MIKRAKGFTLVEFLVAALVFSIITVGAGSLIKFHGTFIKQSEEYSKSYLDSQFAVNHMKEEIANSAWIIVHSPSHIELRSHSNPEIRHYYFANEKLEYKAGTSVLPLISNISSNNFFTGIGEVRNGNQFKEVSINFWKKSDKDTDYKTKDIFYIEKTATSRENWNLIFVDPVAVSTLQDGTKIRPFATITEALNISMEKNVIYVVSGEQIFSDVTIVKAAYIYFAPAAGFTVLPGATLKMSTGCHFMVNGKCSLIGTKAKPIFFEPIDPSGNWGGIYIELKEYMGSIQRRLEISYVKMVNNLHAFNINARSENNRTEVELSHCDIRRNYTRINGFHKVDAYNNFLEAFVVSNATGDINIFQNYITYRLAAGNASHAENAKCVLKNNTIDSKTYYGISAYLYSPSSSYEIISNKIKSNYSAVILYGNTEEPSQGAYLLIANNVMEQYKDGYGGSNASGIYQRSNMKTPAIITNNEIKNFKKGYVTMGILMRGGNDVEIKNNIIHDCNWGLHVGPNGSTSTKANVHNNIFYNNSQGVRPLRYPQNYGDSEIWFVNNTLYGDPITGTDYFKEIKNCIVWGSGASIESHMQDKVSYSDVAGMTPDPENGIRSEDPLFVNAASKNFSLKNNSPLKGTGDPAGTDMGAYGGAYDPLQGIGPQEEAGITEEVGITS